MAHVAEVLDLGCERVHVIVQCTRRHLTQRRCANGSPRVQRMPQDGPVQTGWAHNCSRVYARVLIHMSVRRFPANSCVQLCTHAYTHVHAHARTRAHL